MIWISLSVENMLLGTEKEVWDIADTSRDIVQTHGDWELLGINKTTPKMSLGTSLYDQIMFYVSSEALDFFLSCFLLPLPRISTNWVSLKFQGFSVLLLFFNVLLLFFNVF